MTRGLEVALGAYLGVLALQRIAELRLSARNAAALRAAGAVQHGAGHFPFIVLVHVLFPACLIAEVALLGARPGSAWPVWLVLWLAAQGLRYAAIRALGPRWNVRVWVLPGAPTVRDGPYRWLRHPNYLAVAIELVSAPMMFGAWRTACLVSALNAAVLWVRIRVEERALGMVPARGAADGLANRAER